MIHIYSLGLSISYERVLEIENVTADGIFEQFKADGVVCPVNLRKNLFTAAAYDNIDHNPSSTTAKDAFHGTGVSVFQHPDDNFDQEREKYLSLPLHQKKRLNYHQSIPQFFLHIL